MAASAPGRHGPGWPATHPAELGTPRTRAFAGGIFFALLALAFQRPIAASRARRLHAAFYIPMAYYTDRFFYSRRLSKIAQEDAARKQGGG